MEDAEGRGDKKGEGEPGDKMWLYRKERRWRGRSEGEVGETKIGIRWKK